MPSVWGANSNINLGTIVKAGSTQYSGLHFKCTAAGQTGSSEPDWPSKVNVKTIDGSVVWLSLIHI